MVYTSISLALACLEFFVHLDPDEDPPDIVSTCAALPDDATVETIELRDLPEDWRKTENPALQELGAKWIAGRRSVARQVPSAVVGGDWNVLLNPAHPDFARIKVEEPKLGSSTGGCFGNRRAAAYSTL